ncbi:MAG: helix-turn-helix transcriptional regulator [Clostridiaceae bacterium]
MKDIFKNLPWNKKIEVLRIIKGWTQNDAAEKCNTNQKTYWSWEVGERYPRKNSRLAIVKAFEVRQEEIFN